ncbi:GGDEF domain-containing protein [Candidatus Pantoea persica]|uniref:GGDEF domain-containing protein n=1 Tax=Candidatus Pantoea persica TaxID=2518128 RepID=UPI002867FAFF|nr:GGDEF domain-containing protein [Candidatus Pantoea persica]
MLARTPAALIILDIDFFKRINDEHGHPVGDRVIIEMVARIQRNLPPTASIGRIGGEEFTILLPNTWLSDAVSVAGAILASLNASPLNALPEQLVTASLGVSYSAPGSDFETLYYNADAAMYDTKKHGRNPFSSADRPSARPFLILWRALVAARRPLLRLKNTLFHKYL